MNDLAQLSWITLDHDLDHFTSFGSDSGILSRIARIGADRVAQLDTGVYRVVLRSATSPCATRSQSYITRMPTLPKPVSLPDRTTLLLICSSVPCEMRTLRNYYDPDRKVYLTASHHIARVLREMGLDDPRAIAPVVAPEPAAPEPTRATRTRADSAATLWR